MEGERWCSEHTGESKVVEKCEFSHPHLLPSENQSFTVTQ